MNTFNKQLISDTYKQLFAPLYNYVCARITDCQEAEDIVQEVFLRLMGYEVIAKETVKSLCFTVANNIVIDHIRRHYKKQEMYSYIYDMMENRKSLTPEQVAVFHDLAEQETCIVAQLSPATANVYRMTQFDGKSIEEIAQELNISRRTVECHQFKARKYIREEIRKII